MRSTVRNAIIQTADDPRTLRFDIGGLPDAPEPAQGSGLQNTISIQPWPIPPEQLIDFYYSSPWLGAIGNVLADAISAARWELSPDEYDERGRPLEQPDQNEYARAMAWLSRDDIGLDGVTPLGLRGLMRSLALHMDTTGNILLEAIRTRNGRELRQFGVLLPQYSRFEVEKTADGSTTLMLFQSDPYRGEVRFIPFGMRARNDQRREYLHHRAPNLISSVYGLPTWIHARESVEVDNAHRRYLKGFFSNHSAPRWMIEITMDPAWLERGGIAPSEDDADTVYNAVINYLNANRGAMAGRNLVLRYPGGILVRVTALDQKLEDPTFGKTTSVARDEIMAVRHISLIDLGLPEGGYRATAETQSSNFREQLLQPFAEPAVSLINRALRMPAPFGIGLRGWHLKLEFESVGDTLKRVESIIKAAGVAVLTPNEGRALLEYERVNNPAMDQVYVGANMVPLEIIPQGGPDAAPA
jgi:phage portal protein BeeE